MQQTIIRCQRQQGQAMAEGLIVLSILLSLWFAVSWLGTLQDMALQVSHGSRYMAFAATRGQEGYALEPLRSAYFSGPAHQWSGRPGGHLLGPDALHLRLDSSRATTLKADAQPGGQATTVFRLRTELGTADSGILTQTLMLDPAGQGSASLDTASAPASESFIWPRLRRQTSILTGLGHAPDDAAVQQRLGASPTAWENSAQTSYALNARIDSAMGSVDAAWRRSRPAVDWLRSWGGQVPEQHILPKIGACHAYPCQ